MENKRILIVVSKYYKEISAGLLKGTIDTLNNYREGNNNIINTSDKDLDRFDQENMMDLFKHNDRKAINDYLGEK